jgi:hypothetical protein
VRVVSASFHDSDGLGGELNHWLWRNSISLLGRLMIWRRREPTVRHDALLLDAELQIMLSELRYPSIYKPGASSRGTVANIKRADGKPILAKAADAYMPSRSFESRTLAASKARTTDRQMAGTARRAAGLDRRLHGIGLIGR